MTSAEPLLRPSDSGDPVLELQTRLQAVGLFDGPLDGSFGESTADAVKQLQQQGGLMATGEVDEPTWAALAALEVAAGLASADVPLADASTPIGTLSEDQHWRWDGHTWQAADLGAAAFAAPPDDVSGEGHVSADGQWVWDGNRWRPVTT